MYEAIWLCLATVPLLVFGAEPLWATLPVLLICLAAGATWVIHRGLAPGVAPLPRKWELLLVAWIGLAFLSASRSQHLATSLWEIGVYLALVALFRLVHAELSGEAAAKRLVGAVSLVVTGAAVHGLHQTLLGSDLVLGTVKVAYQGQVTGTFVNSSHFASLLVLTLFPTIALVVSARPVWLRPLFFMAALVLGLALVMTKSRGGWLAALVGLGLGGLVWFRRGLRLGDVLVALVVVVMIAGAVATLFPGQYPALKARFESIDPTSPEGLGLFGRLVLWKGTIELMFEHPVLGSGPGMYWLAFLQHRPRGYYYLLSHTHNEYLQAGAELGLGGLLLSLALALTCLGDCSALVRSGQTPGTRALGAGLMAGMGGFLAHCLWDWPLHVFASALTFTCLCGAVTALLRPETPAGDVLPRRWRHRWRVVVAVAAIPAAVLVVQRGLAEAKAARAVRLARDKELIAAREMNRESLALWPSGWTTAVEQSRVVERLASLAELARLDEETLQARSEALGAALQAVVFCRAHPEPWRAVASCSYELARASRKDRQRVRELLAMARRALGRAIALDPNHHLPRIHLGNLSYRLGDMDGAFTAYASAMDRYPLDQIGKYPDLMDELPPVLDVCGPHAVELASPRRDLALRLLARRKTLAPRDFRSYRRTAEAYRALGWADRAEKEFADEQRLCPSR